MTDLIAYFFDNDIEDIEIALCEGEEVIINQEGEDPADILASFAELIPGLSGGKTKNDTFKIQFQNRTHEVALEQCPSVEDRIRMTIRDVLRPDYEIRILRSCLGTDTLAVVVDTASAWQQIDIKFQHIASELFTAFSDDIGFNVSP